MKLREVRDILNARVLCGEEHMDWEATGAFAGDYMSDVLAFASDQVLLLTGMINHQVIRTAVMMDMKCIIFVRGKVPDEDIIELAKENDIVLMATTDRMYPACGKLYKVGLPC